MRLLVVSGCSGSGKSVALHALEDMGCYCVDNLPINLLPQLTHLLSSKVGSLAISLDVRNLPATLEEIDHVLRSLPREITVQCLFLEADHFVLLQRYRDTQRRHPLSRDYLSLEAAIDAEKALLVPMRARADLVVDTSRLSLHQLVEIVHDRLSEYPRQQLMMLFESFGFKYGVPRNADYLFDVRFLPNPHWNRELRPMTGLDEPVAKFLACQPEVTHFIKQTCDYLKKWLPMIERHHRAYLTIAVGCTGGRHRSVYVAEQLADHFRHDEKCVASRHTALGAVDVPL